MGVGRVYSPGIPIPTKTTPEVITEGMRALIEETSEAVQEFLDRNL